MMDTFKDKVVLITGAGRGVGRALAQGFAREGAMIAANDLTPANLEKTLESIKVTGGNARPYLADVAKSMPVHSMIKQIQDDWGTLDVVVNNAAVAPRAPVLDMDEWDWQRTLDVNLSGPFWLAQAAGQAMEVLGGGVMLNLIAQPDWLLGLHEQAAYLSTQYGLIGFTLATARELAPLGIRVNGLLIGSIDISSAGDDLGDAPRQLNGAKPGTGVPLSKVVEQALYLCSPAASELSGQIMAIGKGAK